MKSHTLGIMVALALAATTGCSKSPKQLSLAGFEESCNAVKTPEVEKYCDCMVTKLDAEIPARVYNDPEADQMALLRAFQATAQKLAPLCKEESGAGTPEAQEAAAAASRQVHGSGGNSSVEFDSRDPESLSQMMVGMSIEEQAQFINDFELLVFLRKGGEGEEGMGNGAAVLNGYTLDQIRTEAPIGRKYIKERNAEFLRKTLSEIQHNAQGDGCIYTNKFGALLPPRTWLRPHEACKRYTREQLEAMLRDAGGGEHAGPSLEQATPSAEGSETEAAPSQPLSDADQFLAGIAEKADAEYQQRWESIKANPQGFVETCTKENADMAIQLGGSDPGEARKAAEAGCTRDLADLDFCMKKPGASAHNCLDNVFFRGD